MPESSQLRLVSYRSDRYLIEGDATKGPVPAIVPAAGVMPPRSPGRRRPFRLKIFHLNDLHGNVVKFTRFGSKPVFSKVVWRVEEVRRQWARKENAAALFLTAGDDMAGSVFDELLGQKDPLHAGYHLYSAAGVDAGIIGNHDLDMGTAQLAHSIAQDAGFPLLAANLVHDPPLAYPAALIAIKGVRVGLIGLTTSAQIKWCQDALEIADPVQTLHNLLPAIQPLCDVLIVLSHLGNSTEARSAEVPRVGDVELARSLPAGSVNLIVGGHTHQALNCGGLEAANVVNGIPIVQAGSLGQYLGEVTLTIADGDNATVTDARLIQTDDLPVAKSFERDWIQPLIYALSPIFNQDLGYVQPHQDLTTEAIRNDFNAGESALANFITDAIVDRCRHHGFRVDLAMIDHSIVRSGLPSNGRLTFRDWFNLMPTVDTIRLCCLTGRQLLELIQDNAYRLARPDEPNTENGFLHFSRTVRYTILQGHRRWSSQAINLTVGGESLATRLDHSFTVACHSFIRGSARSWEDHANGPLVDIRRWIYKDPGLFLRDELLAAIRERGGITGAQRDGRIKVIQRSRLDASLPRAAITA
jgi:5'-nucleotidase/UDP-sugar diphosphatase